MGHNHHAQFCSSAFRTSTSSSKCIPLVWLHSSQTKSKVNKNGKGDYIASITIHPTDEEQEQIKKQMMKEFEDVFTDVGSSLKEMNCIPSVIQPFPEVAPIILSTARNLAFATREERKIELDKMVCQGVMKPVGHKATEWYNPMVVGNTHGGGIRICVNLSKLNKYVKRPSHSGSSPKDVVADIPPNQQFFTTVDAVKGYLQIPMAEESQELTTFITPWGS